jgi:hypothetical protein
MLAKGLGNERARGDALNLLLSCRVLVATWPSSPEAVRTLTNSDGEQAMPMFSGRHELLTAARRFGWTLADGSMNSRELAALDVLKSALAQGTDFVVVDICAGHAVEFGRDEIESALASPRASKPGNARRASSRRPPVKLAQMPIKGSRRGTRPMLLGEIDEPFEGNAEPGRVSLMAVEDVVVRSRGAMRGDPRAEPTRTPTRDAPAANVPNKARRSTAERESARAGAKKRSRHRAPAESLSSFVAAETQRAALAHRVEADTAPLKMDAAAPPFDSASALGAAAHRAALARQADADTAPLEMDAPAPAADIASALGSVVQGPRSGMPPARPRSAALGPLTGQAASVAAQRPRSAAPPSPQAQAMKSAAPGPRSAPPAAMPVQVAPASPGKHSAPPPGARSAAPPAAQKRISMPSLPSLPSLSAPWAPVTPPVATPQDAASDPQAALAAAELVVPKTNLPSSQAWPQVMPAMIDASAKSAASAAGNAGRVLGGLLASHDASKQTAHARSPQDAKAATAGTVAAPPADAGCEPGELRPLETRLEEALLDQIAEALRKFPEVEWACEVSDGTNVPVIGLRVEPTFLMRVDEIKTAVTGAGESRNTALSVLLLIDPQQMREARAQGSAFFPWRKRPAPKRA